MDRTWLFPVMRKLRDFFVRGIHEMLQIVGLGNWPRYVNRPANDVKFSDTVPRTFNLQGPGLGAGRGRAH